jgi:hypothetical protein
LRERIPGRLGADWGQTRTALSSAPAVAVKPDSKVEKWTRDLERIKNEVLGMHHARNVYRTVGRIVDEHGQLPSSLFFDYLRTTYAISQALAIRRQAETRSARVIALGSLLAEKKKEPARLTRERFLGMYEPGFEDMGERAFAAQFAGAVGDHIDAHIVAVDLHELGAAAAGMKKWADQHVAHAGRRPLKTLPTFEDLDLAVDTIGDLFRKYALLLTASSWVTLEPVPKHDWLAVFRQAWIPLAPQ